MGAGELLIIGGNKEKCTTGEILSKFVELSKQQPGTVGKLPSASSIPEEVSADYSSLFRKLGTQPIVVLNVDSREKANDAEMLQLASGMSALFITGGDQERLSNLIKGTKLHDLLMEKWNSGMVIGGTSAGASIMGKHMIVYSENQDIFDMDFIAASNSDFLILKEDMDLRGRNQLEVPLLMKSSAENALPAERIYVIPEELDIKRLGSFQKAGILYYFYLKISVWLRNLLTR